MTRSLRQRAFISYRRQDSLSIARWLSEVIKSHFGSNSVFFDSETIQGGDEWPESIQQGLDKSTAQVVVIGPEWLKAQDKHGRRRLDDPNDWVRKEIQYALDTKRPIIPLLVSKAVLPTAEALPECLCGMLNYQAIDLIDEAWREAVRALLVRLEEAGLRSITPVVSLPPPAKRPKELSDAELDEHLGTLPEWTIVSRTGSGGEERIELRRMYSFQSFEDAIHYIATASRHIAITDHHPHWDNVWRTVTVWLTTWDIGYKISRYDVALARYLEELYGQYRRE